MNQRIMNKKHAGVTLTEVVMATLVTGVILVGALSLLGGSIRTRRAAANRNIGARLAEELLAEVIALPYKDPEDSSGAIGPNSGESTSKREEFDDVDDYNGWSEDDLEDREGVKIPEYKDWQRTATVVWIEQLTGNPFGLFDTGLKRIEVTVTAPNGSVTKRFAMRSKVGSLQQAPATDTTVVTMISGKLQVGDSSGTSRATTNTFNYAVDPNAP